MNNGLNTDIVNGIEQDTDDEKPASCITESNRNNYTEDGFLNSDISPQEVTEARDHLKANMAAGLDGIIPEVFTLITELYLFLCTALTLYLCQVNTQKHGLKRQFIRYTKRVVFMSRTTTGVSLYTQCLQHSL